MLTDLQNENTNLKSQIAKPTSEDDSAIDALREELQAAQALGIVMHAKIEASSYIVMQNENYKNENAALREQISALETAADSTSATARLLSKLAITETELKEVKLELAGERAMANQPTAASPPLIATDVTGAVRIAEDKATRAEAAARAATEKATAIRDSMQVLLSYIQTQKHDRLAELEALRK